MSFKNKMKVFVLFMIFCVGIPSIAAAQNYIPQYAVDYAEQHKIDFLRQNSQSASDLNYRFFYNNNGEACLEFTVTPRGNYRWPKPTWVGRTWGNISGSIGINNIHYTLTKRLSDEADYRMEERREDNAFREIERVVLQIATEYDYDFQSIGISSRFRGQNVKRAVCEGYSDAVADAFRNHPLVARIETWSSAIGNHAWNVIVLNDGRKIYCDSTWYDGNSIDNEGYVVNIPVRNPVNLTFDINEFNSLGGAINRTTNRQLQVHNAWPDARIK